MTIFATLNEIKLQFALWKYIDMIEIYFINIIISDTSAEQKNEIFSIICHVFQIYGKAQHSLD